jgi:HEAT repeat protein
MTPSERGEPRNPTVLWVCGVIAAAGLGALFYRAREPGGAPLRAVAPASPTSPPMAGSRPPPPAPRRALSEASAGPKAEVRAGETAATEAELVADLGALLGSAHDAAVRRAAAHLLGELGTPSAVAVLLQAIATVPPGESADCLLAGLEALQNPEAAPALSALLLRTGEPAVVTTVRETLARLADGPGVWEIVSTWHEGASEPWQQANLEGALLNVRSPASVPMLREILLHDGDARLRGGAARALGYIGGPDSADALAAALAAPGSAAVTSVVNESLALLRRRTKKDQPDDPP